MRKNFGKKTIITPLPVLILCTYDEEGIPNAMNAAWGGQIDMNQIYVSLSKHKTIENLLAKKAFTVAFANKKHVKEADYFGIESGNNVNKIEKVGMHAYKSEYVDAPVIEEFPLSLECEVVELKEDKDGYVLLGEVVNMSADESILTDGKVDLGKLEPIMFDSSANVYRLVSDVVGNAFADGRKWM